MNKNVHLPIKFLMLPLMKGKRNIKGIKQTDSLKRQKQLPVINKEFMSVSKKNNKVQFFYFVTVG